MKRLAQWLSSVTHYVLNKWGYSCGSHSRSSATTPSSLPYLPQTASFFDMEELNHFCHHFPWHSESLSSHLCTLGRCLSRCHWPSSAGWAGLWRSSLPDTHRRWSWRKPGHRWTWLGHCLEFQGSRKRSLGSQKSTLFTRTKGDITWGTENYPDGNQVLHKDPVGWHASHAAFLSDRLALRREEQIWMNSF